MAIPREAIEKVVATHPDTALVGVPVSLLRELMRALPAAIGVDLSARPDMTAISTQVAA